MITNDYNKYLNNDNNKKDQIYKVKTIEKTVREVFSIWYFVNKLYIRLIFISLCFAFIYSIVGSILLAFSLGSIFIFGWGEVWSFEDNTSLLFMLAIIFLFFVFICTIVCFVLSIKILSITKSLNELGNYYFNECRGFLIAGSLCIIFALLFGVTLLISLVLFGIAWFCSSRILKRFIHDYSIDAFYPLDLDLDFMIFIITDQQKIRIQRRAYKILHLKNVSQK